MDAIDWKHVCDFVCNQQAVVGDAACDLLRTFNGNTKMWLHFFHSLWQTWFVLVHCAHHAMDFFFFLGLVNMRYPQCWILSCFNYKQHPPSMGMYISPSSVMLTLQCCLVLLLGLKRMRSCCSDKVEQVIRMLQRPPWKVFRHKCENPRGWRWGLETVPSSCSHFFC